MKNRCLSGSAVRVLAGIIWKRRKVKKEEAEIFCHWINC